MSLLTLGLLAFSLSLVLTLLMICVNIVDQPGYRSSHSVPTPRSGGAAIVLAFFIISAFFGQFQLPFKDSLVAWQTTMGAAALFAVLGFMDDLKNFSSIFRLPLQVLLSLAIIAAGVYIAPDALFTWNLPLWLSVLLSLVWLVGFVNAFNFMDGINGLSGGVAIISFTVIALILNFHHYNLLMPIFSILIASTLGFLCLNFYFGRIFMGDVGSLFLGFIFASFALLLTRTDFGSISFWTFPVLYFIYIYDTTLTVIRRGLRKENILTAHKEHLYQLLTRSGWSHTSVALLYYGIFILQGLLALVMQNVDFRYHPFFLLPCLIFAIFYSLIVFRVAHLKKVIHA